MLIPERNRAWRVIAVVVAAAQATVPWSTAIAGETRYNYDALGRLVAADQTGGAAGHRGTYQYDPAGNRTKHVVEGSTNGSATGVVVAPLGDGFVVIPIDRQ